MVTSNLFLDINEIMKLHNLSPEDVASGVGVSAMTVHRWKTFKAKPRSRVIIKSLENYLKTLDK